MNNISGSSPETVPLSQGFLEQIKHCNRLDELGFERLVFYPGMLFCAHDKWWGDRRKRDRPHEGLDICLYRTVKGAIRQLGGKASVPVMFEGKVRIIVDDYLGKSVFVSHHIIDGHGRHLHTIYGHTVPSDNLHSGTKLSEGEIIGTIADAGKKSVMPHVHISVAWIPESVRSQELDWKIIGNPEKVTLVDPLEVIACPYSLIPKT